MQTPTPVSSLTVSGNFIFTGCDDGTVRVYDLSRPAKVLKAVRGLGEEVSSIVCVQSATTDAIPSIWVASGRRASLFDMQTTKMILTPSDASSSVELCSSAEDVLNEISIDENKTFLAFSADSGTVGVMDLRTYAIKAMKAKHTNVCGSVKFIPDRPREIVSGGYDQRLMHFDYHQASTLSTYDIATLPPTGHGEMILSPPFILCTAISSSGLLAAGTADGRVLLGRGGTKGITKKKARKWNGLDAEQLSAVSLSSGPIVALSFATPDVLILTSLLGNVSQVGIREIGGADGVATSWQHQSTTLAKVNALVVTGQQAMLGGITCDGKGSVEVVDFPV